MHRMGELGADAGGRMRLLLALLLPLPLAAEGPAWSVCKPKSIVLVAFSSIVEEAALPTPILSLLAS